MWGGLHHMVAGAEGPPPCGDALCGHLLDIHQKYEVFFIPERSDSISGAKRLHFWSEATLVGRVRGGGSPPGLPTFPHSQFFEGAKMAGDSMKSM